MEKLSPSLLELARTLLAVRPPSSQSPEPPGFPLVNQNLQKSLVQLAGTEGFVSLLRRALALSSAQVPALQKVKVRPDGQIEGIELMDTSLESAAMVVTTQLLELLVTFVGEQLTRRLVHEACRDTSPGG